MQVGQRLSEARRRRNLTLRDIARTTRIPLHYLEAIDRDDVDRMPRGLFARAFVRTYANEVGVNPSELMDSVDEAVSPEPEPVMKPVPAPIDTPVSMRSLLFLIPIAAVCGFYYVGLAPTSTTSEAPQVAAEIPVPTVDHVDPVAAPVPQATSDVELQIQSRGGCIVAVTADGHMIPSQALLPGEPILLKARGEVVLRVGDSGTCAPPVKPSTPPRPRRAQIDAVPQSPVAITHAVDQQSEISVPAAEPAPSASDVLPKSEQPPPPTAVEQF